MREKQLKIDEALYGHLRSYLQNNIIAVLLDNKQVVNDPFIEKELMKIKENIDKSFISEYEIAAQNILTYLQQSRNIDLKNKMRELLTDLLISGVCYYRTKPTKSGKNVNVEILNPVHTFIERNPNEFYLKKSKRGVIRKYMSIENVIYEYGDELSQSAIKKLKDQLHIGYRDWETDRKSTRLNSSHSAKSRMPSSA